MLKLIDYNIQNKKIYRRDFNMALIVCPECKRENVSDTATACPNCGYPIKEHFDKLKEIQNKDEVLINEQEKTVEVKIAEEKKYDEGMKYIDLVSNIDTKELVEYLKYGKAIEYMDKEEYAVAYDCLRKIEEKTLLSNKEYKQGELKANEKKCVEKLMELGKLRYDEDDYMNAYNYLFFAIQKCIKVQPIYAEAPATYI